MVVFASSLFKGPAKDWWVHLRDKFVYNPNEEDKEEDDEDLPFNGGPRYCFLDWDTFTELVHAQFCDPAIELVHEKKMGEIKMTGPAYLFFHQMEREAKLARRCDNESERGVLVQAVRKGIPRSYLLAIANIGFGIPCTYPEWKQHIITMYDECTKDDVYAKTHGLEQ